MSMGFIYVLTSPSGKSYIGQTTRPIKKRFNEHKKKDSGCRALNNAVEKYGWDMMKKVWYECPDEYLDFDETFLINAMCTLSPDGYNIKEGGGNGKHTEATKKKMREIKLGKKFTEDHKKKISESLLGITRSDETKQKIGKRSSDRKHTEESKRMMSEIKLGKRFTEEHKKRIGEAQQGEKHHSSKKVYQYDLENNFIQSFGSCREAARHLNKNTHASIGRCAQGKDRTAYGFIWHYEKNEDFILNEPIVSQ